MVLPVCFFPPLAVLRDCGYVCVLEETVDWNQVELVVHGESVYQCDINNLEFGNNPVSIIYSYWC